MAAEATVKIELPKLPATHGDFLQYLAGGADKQMISLLQPYNEYDAEMRKVFAQDPANAAIKSPSVVPVFAGYEAGIKIRARDVDAEPEKERDSYIMPLKAEDRKASGAPAIVESLQQFKTQFSLFSESALADLDWSNVVAAGSSVITPLLPIPEKYSGSKRAMRNYYHEIFAPASDVDLFIYGLNEEEAIEKIRQIEENVKNALLVETTTVRTKNAITIASQYPTRHVQIVLRIYKSISEILTGFDVDCSCAAFDGKQVWASPRAIAAYMTQINLIDITRRSPSYESRLAKYHGRGFEVFWPDLDRSRIDPTIFERSFLRTEGLARLLVLEKLPKAQDRENYLDQRRRERGRPEKRRDYYRRGQLHDNIKADHEQEVADWVDTEDVSDYHTFTIPYGPKYHASKIEKLLFTKDLLLNAEWNKPEGREVHLHRHPAFFGTVNDIVHDCCGFCPKPSTMEEEDVYKEESKIYVSGDISFIKDDPGRQTIGSFNPLSAHDYTEMAYVGNTELLCKAIVDGDADYVESWLKQEGNDPNTRDFTGRAPLHLAVSQSTLEVVQLLIEHGARMVARLVDGRTALHIAAIRGHVGMVQALLNKSAENEEAEEEKIDARRKAHQQSKETDSKSEDGDASSSSDVDIVGESDLESHIDATTEASLVNIKSLSLEDKALEGEDNDDPDIYDVNVLAWDTPVSPLHLAIVKGHKAVVECLVEEFGADLLLPVKLFDDYSPHTPRGALLTLVLALELPLKEAEEMARLLFRLGASCAQADVQNRTAFHVCAINAPDLLDTFCDADPTGTKRAINHPLADGRHYNVEVSTPLMSAIAARDTLTALKLLALGSKPTLSLNAYLKACSSVNSSYTGMEGWVKDRYKSNVEQPVISAILQELPDVALALVQDHGVDVNTISTKGNKVLASHWGQQQNVGTSLLGEVQAKLKTLLSWTPDVIEDEPPKPLKPDADYLGDFQEGSYQMWVGKMQLENKKNEYQSAWNRHVENKKRQQNREGVELKQAAVFNMIAQFRKLETVLTQRAAQGFYSLHPEITKPTIADNPGHNYVSSKPANFEEVSFTFNIVGTDELRDRITQLMDAAWQNDIEKIRELTLSPWKDSDGQQQPPLRIAVTDQYMLSPFAIAVLHNNLELADAIIDIAFDQYLPGHLNVTQIRTRILGQNPDEHDDISNGDDSDTDQGSNIALEREVINKNFTVDNVGEVSLAVRSPVSPIAMLRSRLRNDEPQMRVLLGQPVRNAEQDTSSSDDKSTCPVDLLQWAVASGDVKVLKHLLGLSRKYMNAKAESHEEPRPFSIPQEDFDYTIKIDDHRMLAELIKSAGAGIPLDSFVKQEGAKLMDKPRYYQGLTVRGARRANWVAQARNEAPPLVEEVRRPIPYAARMNALNVLEWLQSDAPLRCYREYEESHSQDKRLVALAKSKIGFIGHVERFINSQSKLIVHCSLLCDPSKDTRELFKYALRITPDAATFRSQDGKTALLLAFSLFREDEAKILIEAGADQTARDKQGSNIVHELLQQSVNTVTSTARLELLDRMLDLIDKRLLASLLTERNSAAHSSCTPFAWFIKKSLRSGNISWAKKVADKILRRSEGAELGMIDGEGGTCLHHAVLDTNLEFCEYLIGCDPCLINRENSTGRTPYEVVEDIVLASTFKEVPTLAGADTYYYFHRHYQQLQSRRQSLIHRPNSSFVQPDTSAEAGIDSIWKLMQKTKAGLQAAGKDNRILVTLNEANEVARRLSAREQSVSRQAEQDEVSQWSASARSNLALLPSHD